MRQRGILLPPLKKGGWGGFPSLSEDSESPAQPEPKYPVLGLDPGDGRAQHYVVRAMALLDSGDDHAPKLLCQPPGHGFPADSGYERLRHLPDLEPRGCGAAAGLQIDDQAGEVKVKLSKMVTDRQRWFETVASRFELYAPEMVEALNALLEPELGDDEPMPDMLACLRLQMSRLKRALDRMLEADVAYTDERSFGGGRRRRREELTRELHDTIMDLRDVIRVLYSRTKAEELGFEKRIAHRHRPLLRQTSRILGKLRDPEVQLESSSYEGSEVNRANMVKKIKPLARALRDAGLAVTQEGSTVSGALVEKRLAVKAFDDLALQTMAHIASAFRLAGKSDLAKHFRVLRRHSRPAQSAQEEDMESATAKESGTSEPEPKGSG